MAIPNSWKKQGQPWWWVFNHGWPQKRFMKHRAQRLARGLRVRFPEGTLDEGVEYVGMRGFVYFLPSAEFLTLVIVKRVLG